MSYKPWGLAGPVLVVALVAWTCPAQETSKEKGPSGTVGDKVERAVESIKRGVQDAGDAVREQYAKMRTSVHNMGVSGRIYGRLHWDKALADAKIDVEVRKDGVATLTGNVADLKAKLKAVELTRDTVGVTSVVDKLTTGPVDSPAPANATGSQ